MHRLRLLAPLLLVSCASAADAAAPAGGREGNYPDRPIRLVIPVSVGGGTDIVGRVIAGKLTQVLQQPVVVDNRSGAGGVIGTDMVAKAAPDGYTLLFAYASHTIIPFLGAPVPYDPSRDFAAVAQVTSQPLVLTVTPSLPVSSVKELIALARAKPGQIRAGGPGLGGTGHIAAEILRLEAGIDMPVIVYKGGGPAQLGLMQGEVHLIFATSAAAMSQIKNGRVKVLATSSPQRLPYLPDVPTFAESGLPGIRVSPWQGILAPARTPRSVIDRLHRAVATLLSQPDAVERLTTNGSDIALSSPQELDAKIVKELEYFSRIIRAANIKAE